MQEGSLTISILLWCSWYHAALQQPPPPSLSHKKMPTIPSGEVALTKCNLRTTQKQQYLLMAVLWLSCCLSLVVLWLGTGGTNLQMNSK